MNRVRQRLADAANDTLLAGPVYKLPKGQRALVPWLRCDGDAFQHGYEARP